jgi:hypothetical protein
VGCSDREGDVEVVGCGVCEDAGEEVGAVDWVVVEFGFWVEVGVGVDVFVNVVCAVVIVRIPESDHWLKVLFANSR